jgi:nicotinic acid mononucleotide adenylyltransferase
LNEAEYLKKAYGANIVLLDYIAESISSSELRARLELSMDVSEYVPECVIKFINDKGLYRTYLKIICKLKENVSEETYLH